MRSPLNVFAKSSGLVFAITVSKIVIIFGLFLPWPRSLCPRGGRSEADEAKKRKVAVEWANAEALFGEEVPDFEMFEDDDNDID